MTALSMKEFQMLEKSEVSRPRIIVSPLHVYMVSLFISIEGQKALEHGISNLKTIKSGKNYKINKSPF